LLLQIKFFMGKKILLSAFILIFVFQQSLKAQSPYPLVSIDTLQFVNNSKLSVGNTNPDYVDPVFKNPVYHDTVQVEGIVTFNPKSYGLSTTKGRYGAFLQTADTAKPWGAIQVLLNKDIYPSDSVGGLDQIVKFFSNFDKGLTVRCSGVISEFQGGTQMNLVKVESQITNLTPANIKPRVLPVDVFEKNIGGVQTYQPLTGEQWEGAYIELRNVTVVDRSASGSRWNWTLQDANGNKIKTYDVSNYFRNDDNDRDPATPVGFVPPATGTLLTYVRGTIVEKLPTGGIQEYAICPLLPSDIGPSTFFPPVITNRRHLPVIATSTDTVRLRATITDDSTVTSATMYYAVGVSSNSYTAVTMTSLGNNIYEGKVPPQPNGTVVKYWFRGWDNGGHNSVDTSSNALAYMIVNGGINSIAQLQYSPFSSGNSIWAGDTLTGINIGGIVTSSLQEMDQNSTYFFGSLQSGTAPNSGIFYMAQPNDSVNTWKRGDSVIINSCIVKENFNVTTLDRVGYYNGVKNYSIISSNNNMPAFLTGISIDSAIAKVYSSTEPYEGMLVRFDNVYTVNKNPDAPSNNGEWSIYNDTATTIGLRFDDASKDIGPTYNVDSLKLKTFKYGFMQGVFYYSFSQWKVEPRDRSDINGNDFIAPVITLTGADTVSITRGTAYNDAGATAYDNYDGNITSRIVITNGVNPAVPGTYKVRYNVTDNAGNAATEVIRTVKVLPGAGVDRSTSIIGLSVYPNPVKSSMNIKFIAVQNGEAKIEVLDLNGKEISISSVHAKEGKNSLVINTGSLSEGIYIVKLEIKGSILTTRFVK
jgi:hypothetical protein